MDCAESTATSIASFVIRMGQTMARADPDNSAVEEQRAGWDERVKERGSMREKSCSERLICRIRRKSQPCDQWRKSVGRKK